MASALRETGVVDFDVQGVVRVRTLDAGPADLAAVRREIGPPGPPSPHAPDIVVRFVDALSPERIRLVDRGTVAYAPDSVYFLDSPGGRPRARVTLGRRPGQAFIVCRRGAGRVPFLSNAADLAALFRGWAPLHASAWVSRGRGVLAAGWPHCGKTGALLAACERGAALVGDDRIFLSRDGSRMVGLERPITLRDWHLTQLHLPDAGIGPVRRALAGTWPVLDRIAARVGSDAANGRGSWVGSAHRALGRVRRRLGAQADPGRLAGHGGTLREARPDVLVLLETHRDASVAVRRIDPSTAARRLAAVLEVELMPALSAHIAFEYVAPGRGWTGIRAAPGLAARHLREAVAGRPAYMVRHPYPCSLDELHDVIAKLPGPSPRPALDAPARVSPCPV